MTDVHLTPRMRAMLERIDRAGVLLETALITSGSWSETNLNKLRAAKLVEPCDHPTVTERWGRENYPARGFRLTDAGRAALAAFTEKETRS